MKPTQEQWSEIISEHQPQLVVSDPWNALKGKNIPHFEATDGTRFCPR